MAGYSKGGSTVSKREGSKPGLKDSGSVSDLHGSSSVSRNETEKKVQFAEGGDTAMFGKQAAGPQAAKTTAHDVSGGAPGAKFASGGSNKMFGFAGAEPARSGINSAR